jgi:hypothetical protein
LDEEEWEMPILFMNCIFFIFLAILILKLQTQSQRKLPQKTPKPSNMTLHFNAIVEHILIMQFVISSQGIFGERNFLFKIPMILQLFCNYCAASKTLESVISNR